MTAGMEVRVTNLTSPPGSECNPYLRSDSRNFLSNRTALHARRKCRFRLQ
jgi:hypothetical protein